MTAILQYLCHVVLKDITTKYQLYLSHVVQGEHMAASIEGMQHQKTKSATS